MLAAQMGETPLYSTVKFEKDFRHKPAVFQNENVTYAEINSASSSTVCQSAPAVSQDEDVIYADVKSTNPASSDTVCPSAPAEKNGRSSHPYRLAAVCLGLLCALLLAATLVLSVRYTSLSQNYSLLEADLVQLKASNIAMTEERDLLLGNNTILQREKDLLNKEKNILNQEKDQLQTENNDLIQQKDKLQRKSNNLTQENDLLQRNNSIFQQAFSKKLPFMEQYCPLSPEKSVCKACPQDWKEFDSKCYYFSTESKSWKGSRAVCIKQGADLVIIKSKEEQEFISKRIQGDSWIGLSDAKTEQIWLWVDETPLRTEFWGRGEPNQGYYDPRWKWGADCAVTGTGVNTWKDENCNTWKWFICETHALLL